MTCPGCGGPTRGAVFCSTRCADLAGGLERAWCATCAVATTAEALDDDGDTQPRAPAPPGSHNPRRRLGPFRAPA